jgi:pimeloyl-ACP methyl ester carboxylesterase
MFLECKGTGSPTVVLVSGLGVPSQTWTKVVPKVAPTTRVCRYDRWGLGTSDAATTHPDGAAMVRDVRALLAKAGVPPPYVVAGASFGGLVAQLWARTVPEEVAGVVLIDSLHPSFDTEIEKLLTRAAARQRRAELELNRERIRFVDILRTERQVAAAPPLGDVPGVVVRHGIPFAPASRTWPSAKVEALWARLQAELGPVVVVAAKSGHRIAEQQPTIVARAILDVVNA